MRFNQNKLKKTKQQTSSMEMCKIFQIRAHWSKIYIVFFFRQKVSVLISWFFLSLKIYKCRKRKSTYSLFILNISLNTLESWFMAVIKIKFHPSKLNLYSLNSMEKYTIVTFCFDSFQRRIFVCDHNRFVACIVWQLIVNMNVNVKMGSVLMTGLTIFSVQIK